MIAQAIRAILLARARATSLVGLPFSSRVLAHMSRPPVRVLEWLSTAVAPVTSRVRR